MSTVHYVTTDDEALRLVSRIRSRDRLALVAISLKEGEDEPPFNAQNLAERVDGEADVYVVSAPCTYRLTEGLGGKRHTVHSGWIRVYPADGEQIVDDGRNRFEPITRGGEIAGIRKIERRVLDLAFRNHATVEATAPTGTIATTVTIDANPSSDEGWYVTGQTADGKQVVVKTSNLYRGLANDRLLRKGMRLEGDVEAKPILPSFFARRPEDNAHERLVALVGAGRTTWAYVAAIARDKVTLLLHPEIAVELRAGNDEDFTRQFTEGEVVGVLVVVDDQRFDVVLASSSDDIDEAFSALPGGPPWLAPPEHAEHVEDEADDVDDAMDDDYLALYRANETLREEVARLKREVREAHRLARTRVRPRPHETEEDCFLADVLIAYLSKFPDRPDRDAYPLAAITLGSDFMDGVDYIKGIVSYEKIVEKAMLMACQHPSGRAEPYKVGSPWYDDHDGWRYFRGHIVDETHGAPRFRLARKGSLVRFETCTNHDAEI